MEGQGEANGRTKRGMREFERENIFVYTLNWC